MILFPALYPALSVRVRDADAVVFVQLLELTRDTILVSGVSGDLKAHYRLGDGKSSDIGGVIVDEDLAALRAMAKKLFAPPPSPRELVVDEERLKGSDLGDPTGVLVRAKRADGSIGSVDVAFLDRDSFLAWMCAGGENKRAEVVASIVLGHADSRVEVTP